MFAVPKPEVVADHVETLLKIGLGPHGKVCSSFAAVSSSLMAFILLQADLVLAKYTCIALNRVSGSVKKVKGGCFVLG